MGKRSMGSTFRVPRFFVSIVNPGWNLAFNPFEQKEMKRTKKILKLSAFVIFVSFCSTSSVHAGVDDRGMGTGESVAMHRPFSPFLCPHSPVILDAKETTAESCAMCRPKTERRFDIRTSDFLRPSVIAHSSFNCPQPQIPQ
jgi:hypothetical protein